MAWFHTMGLKREPGIVEAWHEHRELEYRKTEAEKPGRGIEQLRDLDHHRFCHAHVHARAQLPAGFMVVTIFRDPRNVLVSYARHQQRVHGNRISLVEALHDFLGRPFMEVYRGFLPWRRGRSLCLRYEDFPAGFAGDGAGLYRHAKRDHNTWTGEPSNWREVWDYEIDHAWRNAGGWFLVRDAGYA